MVNIDSTDAPTVIGKAPVVNGQPLMMMLTPGALIEACQQSPMTAEMGDELAAMDEADLLELCAAVAASSDLHWAIMAAVKASMHGLSVPFASPEAGDYSLQPRLKKVS